MFIADDHWPTVAGVCAGVAGHMKSIAIATQQKDTAFFAAAHQSSVFRTVIFRESLVTRNTYLLRTDNLENP